MTSDRIYAAGRSARLERMGSESCPYGRGDPERRGWWLAGWHYEDKRATGRNPGRMPPIGE